MAESVTEFQALMSLTAAAPNDTGKENQSEVPAETPSIESEAPAEVKEAKPEVPKQPTRIHLIDGEKGGVGKSLFCRTVIQYCLDEGLHLALVDADRSNPDVSEIYNKVASAVFSEDEKKADSADQIFEMALEKSVIVNLPAQVYEPVTDWIERNALIALGQQYLITFVKWFVCTGGYDSVQLFLKSVEKFGETMPHVLVRNMGLCDDWSHVMGMEDVKKAIAKYGVKVIDFPKFSYRERNVVDANRLTFAAAREFKDFGVVSKQRITNYLKAAYKEFEGTKLLP